MASVDKTPAEEAQLEPFSSLCEEDRKRKLGMAVRATYPSLDAMMIETAVEVFLANPEWTPEKILASVPEDYFQSNVPTVTQSFSDQLPIKETCVVQDVDPAPEGPVPELTGGRDYQ